MRTILVCLFCTAAFQFVQCQDADGEFVSLFDGESLDGWKVSEENSQCFLVEDGKMVARGGKAHIFYNGAVGKHDFKNFELKLKVMTNEKSNSGVYFHTKYQASGWPTVGFEAQVNSRHSDPRKTGSLYGIVNMWVPEEVNEPFISRTEKSGEVFIYRDMAPSSDGEWFDYHIKVVDDRVVIKVNGVITVDWTQPKNWEKGERKLESGTIGFQAHDPTCEVYYKDITIKILD